MKLLYAVMIAVGLIWTVLSQMPYKTITANISDQVNPSLPAQTALAGTFGQRNYQAIQTHTAYNITGQSLPVTQAAKLLASDGITNARFGYSVAVSGDTIVVGADLAYINSNYAQGVAYVFVKPSNAWSGSLTQTAKLVASDGMMGDQLGWSVAINGDIIVVGALADVHGQNLSGSAYIFVKPPGGWKGIITETAKLTAIDGDTSHSFGDSVAIDGDTVVVLARGNNTPGAAYVYIKPVGGWVTTSTFTAKLATPDSVNFRFGSMVSISGDTIAVRGQGANGSPPAFIFTKPVGGWSGTLTETAKLIPSDGATNGGWSIKISNDVAVLEAGAAYVFVKPANGWSGILTETAKLTTSNKVRLTSHGEGVTISDDMIVAGASGEDNGRGSAYLFVKPAGGWSGTLTETTKLTATDGAAHDAFGNSVAIDPNTIVVGAVGKADFTGSAYVFTTSTIVDLSLSKSRGQIRTAPGDTITYTLIVTNYGPSAVTEALIIDTMPVVLTGTIWKCVSFNGASCGASAGTGNLNHTINLPANSKAIFTITSTIAATAGGILSNTASVIVPAGFIDTNPGDNSATDTSVLTPSGLPTYLPIILH